MFVKLLSRLGDVDKELLNRAFIRWFNTIKREEKSLINVLTWIVNTHLYEKLDPKNLVSLLSSFIKLYDEEKIKNTIEKIIPVIAKFIEIRKDDDLF